MYPFRSCFSLAVCPGVRLQNYTVALFLVFLWNLHTVLHSDCTNLHIYSPVFLIGKPILSTCGGGGGLVARSCPTLATPWTVACQAPLSMGFSKQVYWSGLPFPSPGESSQSRTQTQVSCTTGRFFTTHQIHRMQN